MTPAASRALTACSMAVLVWLSPAVAGAAVSDLAEIVVTNANHVAPGDRVVELVVPLRERGPLGQVTVLLGPGDALRVRAEELTNLLSRMITPEARDRLAGVADAEGFISPEAARTVGFDLVFDPALLDLAVTVPLEARQRQSLGLGFDLGAAPPTPSDEPEGFAAYLNYRASLDYIHESPLGQERGLRSPRFDLDFNGTIGRVAFQNLLTVDADADQSFQRNASRLIFDQPDRTLRWTLGDLFAEGTSFQSTPEIAGLSVQRLYSLNYNERFISSSSSRTVTLREPSTVEIRVNGSLARTLILQPGTYDLRDLPLTSGANAVEIVIESQSGAREVILFDFFSDATLLAPGVDEFYAGVGIRAPRTAGEIDYLQDEPVVSAFYRRGITEQLTLGGNVQANENAQLFGAELVYGSDLGLSSVELAASNQDYGSGYALRFEHRWARELPGLPGREAIDFSVETRSEDFGPIDLFTPPQNYQYQVAARYSRPFSQRLSGSIGGDYAAGRGALDDRYGAQAYGTYRLDYRTNINFGVTYASNIFDGDEANLFVNFTRRFGARSTLSGGAESRNGVIRAGYARAPERVLNDWALSADITRNDEGFGFNGAATYATNRGDIEFDHFTSLDSDGGDISTQQSSIRAYGAFAMAGGRFGMGRRVYDAFALVDGHPSLDGRPVLIRGIEAEEESARSGALGPALVPLGSYSPQNVPYDVEDLPPGYDLGTGNFQVFPRLHSGYALTVGSAYYVTATGTLVDLQGFPAPLRTGVAVSLDDPDAPQVAVVTNRAGRFAINGLAPGRWRVTLTGAQALVYELTVPDETLYRVGTLNPQGGAR